MSDEEPTAEELAEAQALALALERLDASASPELTPAAPADALEVAALLRLTQPSAALAPARREAVLAELQRGQPSAPVAGDLSKPSNLRRIARWSGVLSAAAAAVLGLLQLRSGAPDAAKVMAPAQTQSESEPAPPPAPEFRAERQESAREREPAAEAAPQRKEVQAARATREAGPRPKPYAAKREAPVSRESSAPAAPAAPMKPAPMDDLLSGAVGPAAAAPEPPPTPAPADAPLADLATSSSKSESDSLARSRHQAPAASRTSGVQVASGQLAAAQLALARSGGSSSPELERALRGQRAKVLQALLANGTVDQPALQELIAAHAEVDGQLAKSDYAAARRRLAAALAQIRSRLTMIERDTCERDLFIRLAQVASLQGNDQAALQYAQQGIGLGAKSNVFFVQLLLLRAHAFEKLGAHAAASASYAEAAKLAERL